MVCQGGFTMMWMEPQGFSLLQAPLLALGGAPAMWLTSVIKVENI